MWQTRFRSFDLHRIRAVCSDVLQQLITVTKLCDHVQKHFLQRLTSVLQKEDFTSLDVRDALLDVPWKLGEMTVENELFDLEGGLQIGIAGLLHLASFLPGMLLL